MIITKSGYYTKEEIKNASEAFESYIKTVIDVNKKICSAGANMRFESQKLLVKQGSRPADLWGGGINLETKKIDFNSFINMRPSQGNSCNEIEDVKTRKNFEKIMKSFFKEVL